MIDQLLLSAIFEIKQKDVLCNVHILQNVDLLRDKADTKADRVKRRVQLNFLAFDQDFSLIAIRRIDTIETFQDRGFACAVFTDETHDLTCACPQTNVVVCQRAGKSLRNVYGFNHIRLHAFIPFFVLFAAAAHGAFVAAGEHFAPPRMRCD